MGFAIWPHWLILPPQGTPEGRLVTGANMPMSMHLHPLPVQGTQGSDGHPTPAGGGLPKPDKCHTWVCNFGKPALPSSCQKGEGQRFGWTLSRPWLAQQGKLEFWSDRVVLELNVVRSLVGLLA